MTWVPLKIVIEAFNGNPLLKFLNSPLCTLSVDHDNLSEEAGHGCALLVLIVYFCDVSCNNYSRKPAINGIYWGSVDVSQGCVLCFVGFLDEMVKNVSSASFKTKYIFF